MKIERFADEICKFVEGLPLIVSCRIEGSLGNKRYDEYSDIDLTIHLSGVDNGVYLTTLAEMFSQQYSVIFADYSPSLAPEKYVVTLAISDENPFRLVDIRCTATPHFRTVGKTDLRMLNNEYEHTLKLFAANLKHYLRKSDCHKDITKMYDRIFANDTATISDNEMLLKVFYWLKYNAKEKHLEYVNSFNRFIQRIH